MSEDVVQGLRERLCNIGRQLHDRGLVTGTGGNISVRIFGTKTALIKPTGLSMGTLKPNDFALIDLQGKQLEGKHPISVETPMHTAIYRARSDIQGIVHSHAPVATALGIAGIEIIPVVIETFLFIPNGVPIVPFETPGSKELASAVQKTIKNFDALILENHGIVTVGPSIEKAFSLTITVEETARFQYMATLLVGHDVLTMAKIKKKYRKQAVRLST